MMRLFAKYGEGSRVAPTGIRGIAVKVGSVGVTFYILYLAGFGTANGHLQISVFLAFILPITFLTTAASKNLERITVFDIVLAVLGCAVSVFYVATDEVYQNWNAGLSEFSIYDKIAGIALVALLVEATRRAAGWGLTLVVLALLAYTAFGQLLEGGFYHAPIGVEYFLDMQTMGVDGVFGAPLEVASSYAFLFVLFGSFYHISGGGRLFYDIATGIAGRLKGGPAKACVVSSGLYGSISGSPTADVATTGPITIPIMTSTGIPAKTAGAIEAAASSGGALLPPVMGSVAFLMAEFTATPYLEIVKIGALSAILYYFGIFLIVHFEARRLNQGAIPDDQIVGLLQGLKRGWINLVPIAVLVYFLTDGYSPAYVAAAATAVVVATSWFIPGQRIGLQRFVEGCTETVFRMVPLAAAVGAAAVIIGCIELTGLAGKFTLLIFSISQGQFVPSLIVGMVVLILLGMGMPTPGVYIMGAALLAPVFMGTFSLPVLPTHMFVLYFSCMSAITPPVAVACFTAATIAGTSPMAVAPYACKLALAGFLIPFFFVFNPALLLQGDFTEIGSATVLAAALVFVASLVVHGWVVTRRIPWWARSLFAALAVAIIYPEPIVQYLAAASGLAGYALYRYGPARLGEVTG